MIDFSCIRDVWAVSKPVDINRITPDPGVYECTIESVSACVKKTKNGDKPCIVWRFTINSGDNAGSQFERYDFLVDEKSCSRLKGNLALLNIVAPANANDLDIAIKPACGLVVRVEVKKVADYINIYIRKLISLPEAQANTADPQLEVFDHIPEDQIPY